MQNPRSRLSHVPKVATKAVYDPFRLLASKHSKTATLHQKKTAFKPNDENNDTTNLP